MNLAVKVTEHVSGADVPGERQQVGALPWRIQRDGEMRILLITSRECGRWIVPKGWPVKGYPLLVAASREAFEEAGVIGDISPSPMMAFRYQKILDDGSQALCRVTVFGMNVRGTLSHWREKGQRKRQWFSLGEAADRLDDAELAAFVRALDDEPEHPEPFRCTGGRKPPPGEPQMIGG
jgi:8-oxo-dGTP pyrophosphatase MutT (NUDIX family)